MIRWIVVITFGAMIICAQWVGWATQPWARWYMAGASTQASTSVSSAPAEPLRIDPAVNVPGRVGDVERYELALAAGWSAADAMTATAISFAEDGSGDPTALSPRNYNGTYDLGLWQINSSHWPEFGGQEALTLPVNNARAAHAIYMRQTFCAWSTYLASCGQGHTGSFAAFVDRATAAAIRASLP